MKFQYVPLDAILAEVASQFKTFNRQGTYNEDDAYGYAIEAAREIGMNNYDEDTVGIAIRSHAGAIPKDFFLVKEIWIAEQVGDLPVINNIQDAFKASIPLNCLRKKELLYPGDSATVQFCPDKRTPFRSGNPTYTIRKGRIRTDLKDGYIMLNYYHLPKDERGVIQIQDEVNTIKCVKAGILMNMLKEDYVMGKVARYIYKDIEDEYYVYLEQAQGMQKLPDPSADKYYAEQNRNKYNDFKL